MTSTPSPLWHFKMREHQASFRASSLGNWSEAAAANESPVGLLEPRDGAGVNGAFCLRNRALVRTAAALISCWKPELERSVGGAAANQFCLIPVGPSGLSLWDWLPGHEGVHVETQRAFFLLLEEKRHCLYSIKYFLC